ncbi:HicA-like toxin [Mycobacterium phage Funsized]|nr:HicA-like toxin [Mycobacterium phage Funsized]
MTRPEPQPGSRRSAGCRGSRKDTRRLLDAIRAAGGEVVAHTGKDGHWKVYLDGQYIGGIAGTPGDRRSWQNDIARLRRGGLNITSKGQYRGTSPEDRP